MMIKNTWAFICRHGYGFMIAGLALVVVAGIMLIRTREAGTGLGTYVWVIGILGLTIYVLGRIGVICNNKVTKRHNLSE